MDKPMARSNSPHQLDFSFNARKKSQFSSSVTPKANPQKSRFANTSNNPMVNNINIPGMALGSSNRSIRSRRGIPGINGNLPNNPMARLTNNLNGGLSNRQRFSKGIDL